MREGGREGGREKGARKVRNDHPFRKEEGRGGRGGRRG
jgi:hypothetical protein